MANITTYLAKIKSAVYGEEVRGAIYDSINTINNDVVNAIKRNANALPFCGDLESTNLDYIKGESYRGIWRLLPKNSYTNLPSEYSHNTSTNKPNKAGCLIVYCNGSYCIQELHYYEAFTNSPNTSFNFWKRSDYIGGGLSDGSFSPWASVKSYVESIISSNSVITGLQTDLNNQRTKFQGDVDYANDMARNAMNKALELERRMDGGEGGGGGGGSVVISTDATLTQSGVPADAKAAGDKIAGIRTDVDTANDYARDAINTANGVSGRLDSALDSINSAFSGVNDNIGDINNILNSAIFRARTITNGDINLVYNPGIYGVLSPSAEATQNWPYPDEYGTLAVFRGASDSLTPVVYCLVQVAFCSHGAAFRMLIPPLMDPEEPIYTDWMALYSGE